MLYTRMLNARVWLIFWTLNFRGFNSFLEKIISSSVIPNSLGNNASKENLRTHLCCHLCCSYSASINGSSKENSTHHEQVTRPNLQSCHTATFEGDVEKMCFFQAFCHNCWKVKKLQRLGHKSKAFFLKSRNLARTVLEPSRRNPVPRNLPRNPWFGTCPGNFPELVNRNLPGPRGSECGSEPAPEPVVQSLPRNPPELPGTRGSEHWEQT